MQTLAPVTADRSVVLVAGQAVAYWARILCLVDDQASDDLLASKDIDFEGGAEAARAAAALLHGRARIPSFERHTPITAMVCSSTTATGLSGGSISSLRVAARAELMAP